MLTLTVENLKHMQKDSRWHNKIPILIPQLQQLSIHIQFCSISTHTHSPFHLFDSLCKLLIGAKYTYQKIYKS